MKEKIIEWFLPILFSVLGIAVLLVGIFITINDSKLKAVAIEQTAKVDSISKHTDSDSNTSYTVYISYNVDGKTYKKSYKTSSYVYEGSNVKIYVDKNNPNNMRTEGAEIVGIVFDILGVIFTFIGLGFLFNKINKLNKKRYLLANGEKIDANIKDVTMNYNYNVNGKFPYIIICEGTYNRRSAYI